MGVLTLASDDRVRVVWRSCCYDLWACGALGLSTSNVPADIFPQEKLLTFGGFTTGPWRIKSGSFRQSRSTERGVLIAELRNIIYRRAGWCLVSTPLPTFALTL